METAIKTEQIKLYGFTQPFRTDDGEIVLFGGHLAAASIEQAVQLASNINARLDGELVSNICAGCGTTKYYNNSNETDDLILEQEIFN